MVYTFVAPKFAKKWFLNTLALKIAKNQLLDHFEKNCFGILLDPKIATTKNPFWTVFSVLTRRGLADQHPDPDNYNINWTHLEHDSNRKCWIDYEWNTWIEHSILRAVSTTFNKQLAPLLHVSNGWINECSWKTQQCVNGVLKQHILRD